MGDLRENYVKLIYLDEKGSEHMSLKNNIRIKRIADITLSSIGIILLLPLFIIISILVAINLGSPIFFKQRRIGFNGEEFNIIKFRTMTEERYSNGNKLEDKYRTTWFGDILRKSSLDEIPELINVLKGEMSLIGPRPLLTEYRQFYTKEEFRRHDVRPGITGWAQVNGRNSISWGNTFKLDVWYVDNMNILLDIKIMFMTIIKVLQKSGIENKRDELKTHHEEQEKSTNE